MINIDEIKSYLKIDFGDDDTIISEFLKTAELLVAEVARLEKIPENPDNTIRIAILFTTGYLYENRTNPDYKKLKLNLRSILSAKREDTI